MSNVDLTVAKARLRETHSGDVVSKAVEKAKRWMKSAYGEVSWEDLENETGIYELLKAYCDETEAKPNGLQTFNREK